MSRYIRLGALLFVTIFIFYSCEKQTAQVNLESGMVAYFPLNANANDSTGNVEKGVIDDAVPTKDRFGRPTPVGGNLKEWGARVNIRKFGIPAKPWIAKMLTSLSDQIAKDIEITLPPQIEAEVAKLLGSIK